MKKASAASIRQRKELSSLVIKTVDYDQPREDWPSEFDQSGRNIKETLYSCEYCYQPFNRDSKRVTHQINCGQKPVFDSEDESPAKKANKKQWLDNSSEDGNSEKENSRPKFRDSGVFEVKVEAYPEKKVE